MRDSVDPRDGPDGLSRRTVLYAAAAIGATAASGNGVAALLTDTERVRSRLRAGTLDLDVAVRSPRSWRNGSYAGELVLHEARTAEFELSVDTNPAFVWLVSPCPTCDDVEPTIAVELSLTRPGSGTTTLFTGTLDAFRETYGRGGLLSTRALAGGTETWTVTFTWMLLEPLPDGASGRRRGRGGAAPDVGFEFEFRAVQERHLGDPELFDLGLPACADCGPETCGESISFVAFCGDEAFAEADVAFTRETCGGEDATLDVTAVPSGVDTIVLKYATYMDVFRYDGEATPFRVTTGGGDSDLALIATHEKERRGNGYTAAGQPTRFPNEPCPGDYWVKFEAFGGDAGTDAPSVRADGADLDD
mgnify:CR=1 FL=1